MTKLLLITGLVSVSALGISRIEVLRNQDEVAREFADNAAKSFDLTTSQKDLVYNMKLYELQEINQLSKENFTDQELDIRSEDYHRRQIIRLVEITGTSLREVNEFLARHTPPEPTAN
ncbi:hypothetical protein [Reichenbachiella versicolor]|uniref:hypothetical protein n=1 Tax=Reichenbachiella versicolor TaxID=1821036 RepID=UPI000D6E27DC|nr:hypothetical protein [Reichenbachiella versicolor]